MDNQHVLQVPALARLGLQPGQLFFGHAGVVFQRHGTDFFVTRIIADQPDETGEPADLGIGCRHAADFRADIEVFGLYPDHRVQPPVIGGKTATSSPSAIAASSGAIS